MIPKFDERGNLPSGIHRTTSWDDIHRRFGNNSKRIEMLDGLRMALDLLKRAGCKKVYLDGSFVTNKQHPNDYDCCWDTEGVDGASLDKSLLDTTLKGRSRQKMLFRGEFFPSNERANTSNTFLEFFQIDRENLGAKGIVEIDLEKLK